jgi:YidC/Oxa1 family membrane protein insertase
MKISATPLFFALILSSLCVSAQAQTLTLQNAEVEIGAGDLFFSGWKLRNYRTTIDHSAPGVSFSDVLHQSQMMQLGFDSSDFLYLSTVRGTLESQTTGVVWSYEDDKVRLQRKFTPAEDGNSLNVLLTIRFKTPQSSKYAFVSLVSKNPNDPDHAARALKYWSQKTLVAHAVNADLKIEQSPQRADWIAATSRYFIFTAVAQGQNPEPRALTQPGLTPDSGRISLTYPITDGAVEIPLKVYFGPKDLGVMRAIETSLDHTVDFGWFTFFAYPLLWVLKFFYSFSGNYGVAIILLTLVVRLLTYPLNYKASKSMKEMAKLQPQIKKLQDKYGSDREALNREMMLLMRGGGYNPLAGCLPILAQMPVFIALYNVLALSVELYQAPFAFWIHDLSAKDSFYVLPLLVTVTWYLQQRLTPTSASMDPTQKKILQFMPIIFGVMMVTQASGLSLYFFINAASGIVQQIILNKQLGLTPDASAVTGAAKPA